MHLLTPPLTPFNPATSQSQTHAMQTESTMNHKGILPSSMEDIPESLALPPPVSSPLISEEGSHLDDAKEESVKWEWRPDMTEEERLERREWLSKGRGRSGLRIVIVTENFLPKIDGVTRTLARLLEHLEREGHQCMLLGPGSGMDTYAGHPLVGTAGIPLVVYPGLKLNFLRPKFLRTIKDFQPDVVHFVDPIWLGAQTLIAMELGWAGEEWVGDDGPALGTGIKGAVVASYHTNLATYATLFGLPRLTPIVWRLQQWLYSKTQLTLCPSPSTRGMLQSKSFDLVRLWPRGVDLSQFAPLKRSATLRASWGVGHAIKPSTIPATFEEKNRGLASEKLEAVNIAIGLHHEGRKASLPLTPPESPAVGPVGHAQTQNEVDSVLSSEPGDIDIELQSPPARVVFLYVGRISWEKNIHLLLSAYARLPSLLPAGSLPPKLVFVGDGPARSELETTCQSKGYDAVFMGQRVGEELASCFASADVFAFPSFTETFGQVVLEALASGLPVVGLDAEGTRDLVTDTETGLLLRLPSGCSDWPSALKSQTSTSFVNSATEYANLLERLVTDHATRNSMGLRASTEGIKGFSWWAAMEKCVDGYREAMCMSREKVGTTEWEDHTSMIPTSPSHLRVSRVNRVVSRRLAHRGKWSEEESHAAKVGVEERETAWHLKSALKVVLMLLVCWMLFNTSG